MPDAAVIQVADAVKELLAPAVASEDVDAVIQRAYVPVRDLAETETMLVSVVPGLGESPPETRTLRRRVYRIGVSVQQRVPVEVIGAAAIKEWLDGKLAFVEGLQTVLEDNRLGVIGSPFPLDAVPVLVEIESLFLPDELEQDRVMAAEIFATYRTTRTDEE